MFVLCISMEKPDVGQHLKLTKAGTIHSAGKLFFYFTISFIHLFKKYNPSFFFADFFFIVLHNNYTTNLKLSEISIPCGKCYQFFNCKNHNKLR